MKKYRVNIPYAVFVTVDVEAENEEQAIDKAFEDGYLTGFCGNGGTDKLVGVTGSNVSIEHGEEALEIEPFKIEVYEAE